MLQYKMYLVWFLFMSPTAQELKITFLFLVLLRAILLLPGVHEQYEHWRINHAILIANVLVLI